MSVPLDLFCQTLEAALLKARHSVRTLTSGMAQSVRALDPTMDSSATGQAGAGDEVDFLLESWLTQIEEHHEVQGEGTLSHVGMTLTHCCCCRCCSDRAAAGGLAGERVEPPGRRHG